MARLLRRGARSLCVCVFLLYLTGCQSRSNPWQGLAPPSTLLTEAQPVWERLAARRQHFENLRGLASVQLRVGTRRAELEDVAIVLRHFDALRLEGLGPVMQPLFLLLADEQRLALYAPQDGRLLVGAASADNLLRLFGLALAPQNLQYVLIGDVPWPVLPTTGQFAYVRRENLYLWQGLVQAPARYGRVWFEPYDWRPVRFALEEPPGHLILQGWYEDFIQLPDFSLPTRITLSQPVDERTIRWQYRDVQINAGVNPGLFRLRVPPGTERRAIEDLPEPEADTLPRLW